LADILVEKWDKISFETIQVLYESISRMIKAVLKSNVGPTPYLEINM
jgi:hypothetical protein